jgi:integrase
MMHHAREEPRLSKTIRETQAEAVAFVVCRGIGFETSSAASDYIALYNGNNTLNPPYGRAIGSWLSETALRLVVEWKAHVKGAEREALVFATRLGKPVSPNNVLRRSIFPSLRSFGSAPRDLADVPPYVFVVVARQRSAWEVVAQLMGHANVDTTLNVYTQVLDGSVRDAVEKIGGELFTIVHRPEKADAVTD